MTAGDKGAPTVCRAEPGDAGTLARIHLDALPGDFLPSLGADFLKEVYYPATFRSTHGANLVATIDDRAAGFATIAHDSAAFTRDVVGRTWPKLVWFAARAALRQPGHLKMSIDVAWSALYGPADAVPGEIVLIAVDAGYRRRGVATALIAASLAYLAEHDVSQCRTKTLASNDAAIAMYRQLGWRARDHFRLIGRDYVTIVSAGGQH